jgi:hypothetical protein
MFLVAFEGLASKYDKEELLPSRYLAAYSFVIQSGARNLLFRPVKIVASLRFSP